MVGWSAPGHTGSRCHGCPGPRPSICRASIYVPLPMLSSVGLQPRLFALSSGNAKPFTCPWFSVPAFVMRGKEKNHGVLWLYRAGGVGVRPKLHLGDWARDHVQIWSPYVEEAPFPNLLPHVTQPCPIPALTLLLRTTGDFLSHRSGQTLSSQHAPPDAHCPRGKSSSNQRPAWGRLPQAIGPHLLPFPIQQGPSGGLGAP